MVSEAVALNKKFIGVCGMISEMKVVGDPTSKRMPDVKYQDSNSKRLMEINALFDGGKMKFHSEKVGVKLKTHKNPTMKQQMLLIWSNWSFRRLKKSYTAL